jgi:hypothetical protein
MKPCAPTVGCNYSFLFPKRIIHLIDDNDLIHICICHIWSLWAVILECIDHPIFYIIQVGLLFASYHKTDDHVKTLECLKKISQLNGHPVQSEVNLFSDWSKCLMNQFTNLPRYSQMSCLLYR